uniref:condensation domain-containing protein n=1 Tax=Sciscionella sediminilitoris TaxID=1445613 RepID=UPI0005672852
DKRLVAYVVAADGGTVDAAAVRAHVAEKLPGYMVPAAIVVLPELPLTANDKIDRDALPAPEYTADANGREPRTPREELLCGLFAEILGIDHVTIDDNFFDLGGDSITTIQFASRARSSGLTVSARDLFENQTVAGLATAVRETTGERTEEPGAGIGEVAVTPIIQWLADLRGPVDGFNQSRFLRAPAGARYDQLAATLQALLDHHDALRLRAIGAPGTDWTLTVLPPGSVAAADRLRHVDVTGLDAAAYEDRIRTEARAARESLKLTGELVRAVWFDRGPGEAGRLLLVVHHLAVDAVSWRILLPDLAEAWAAVHAGEPVRLAPVGTSFRTWARKLHEWSHLVRRQADFAAWSEVLGEPEAPFGGRPLDPRRDTIGTAASLTVRLPAGLTAAVLEDVTGSFHADPAHVLLAGLAVALDDAGLAGPRGVLVDLESHGRAEEVIEDVDLSRTVGWFTSMYPVRVPAGPVDTVLKEVKEQLRRVTDLGLSYGALRYLDHRTGAALNRLAHAQVGLNYLGKAPAAGDRTADWSVAEEAVAAPRQDPAMPLPHALEIAATVRETEDGPCLESTWVWPRELLGEERIRAAADAWAEALTALARHSEVAGGGFTPSDVAASGLSQDEIDLIEAEWGLDE